MHGTSQEILDAQLEAWDVLIDELEQDDFMKRCMDSQREWVERFDVIVTLAAPGEAPEGREDTGDPIFCSLWTFGGLPAVSLPLVTGPNGLPVGLQLVGPHGQDARLLRTARWLVRTLSQGEGEE